MARPETTAQPSHGDPPPPSKHAGSPPTTKEQRMVKAIVARGRSVMVGTGSRVVGFHPVTEAEIHGPVCEYAEELTEVELPESDVIWMRKAGYLIDPANVNGPMRGEGPSFTELRHAVPQQTAYAR